jgi:hypothetical protein
MKIKSIILGIIFLILISSIVSATTYYVDPAVGNDSEAGTSWGVAWETVGNHIHNDFGYPRITHNDEIIIRANSDFNLIESSPGIASWYFLRNNITIRAESPGNVTVRLNSTMSKALYVSGDDFIIIGIDFIAEGTSTFVVTYGKDAAQIINCSATGFYIIHGSGSATTGTVNYVNFTGDDFDKLLYNARNDIVNFNNAVLDRSTFDKVTSAPTVRDSLGLSDNVSLGLNNITLSGHLNIIESGYRDLICGRSDNATFANVNSLHIDELDCPLELSESILDFEVPNNEWPCGAVTYAGIIDIEINESAGAISIHDFNVGNSTNPLHTDVACAVDYTSLFYLYDAGGNNSYHIYNNTLHFNDTEDLVLARYTNNMIIENNTVYNYYVGNGTYYKSRRAGAITANNSIIRNNYVEFADTGAGYGWAIGVEGALTQIYSNCSIINNTITMTNNTYDGGRHGIFVGYCDGFLVENNTVHGGGINYAIKGNANGIVRGNLANQSIVSGIVYQGIHHKSGWNVSYINNDIYNSCFVSTQNTENMSAEATFYNNTVHNNSQLFYMNSLGNIEKNFTFYDNSPYNISHYDTATAANNTKIEIFYSLNLTNATNQEVTLTDEQGNVSSISAGSYTKTYYLSYKIINNHSSEIDYSNYSWLASAYDQSETGNFIFDAPYTLALPTFVPIVQSSGNSPKTYYVTDNKTISRLKKSDMLSVSLDDTYILKLESILTNSLKFKILGTLETITINDNEKIDLDNDNISDLRIDIIRNIGSSVSITTYLLNESIIISEDNSSDNSSVDSSNGVSDLDSSIGEDVVAEDKESFDNSDENISNNKTNQTINSLNSEDGFLDNSKLIVLIVGGLAVISIVFYLIKRKS